MLFGFGSEKSDIIHMFEDAYQVCNGKNLPIQNVTMDNGGENLAIVTFCKHNNIGFKLTPPDTPKLNGVIERGFAVRLEKAKVLMKNANLNTVSQSNKIILMEAIKTAAFLYDECPQKNKIKSPNEIWYGSDYKERVKPHHYVQFGRIGFVKNKRTYVKKNEDKASAMMMVGYALDSPSGTYRFYNPRTNAIVQSNSVTWKEFLRFEDDSVSNFKNARAGGIVREENYDLSNENDVTTPSASTEVQINKRNVTSSNELSTSSTSNEAHVDNSDVTSNNELSTSSTSNEAHVEPSLPTRRITRSMTAASRVADSNTVPNATTSPSRVSPSFDTPTDQPATTPNFIVTGDTEPTKLDFGDTSPFLYHACIQNDPGTPESWKAAIESPEREYWIKSMTAEFNNFLSRGAWKFVPLKDVKNKGRKVIPTKLVFKLKDEIDGSIRFKSRCVTLGYMMVPGVDFTERFSPVATDEALKLQIAITLYNRKKGWTMENCDIEAAFLESDMDNELFIQPHPAMVVCGFLTEEERKMMAIKLANSMYGNVDAAIKFFKTLIDVATEKDGMNMKQSQVDPCLLYMIEDDELTLIVTITVDDCAVSGHPDNVKWFMDGLESRFNITRGGTLSKHLGIDYVWGFDEERGKHFVQATMDKKVGAIIDKLERFLQREVRVRPSPGKPGSYLQKHDEDIINIDEYRSLVGQIMFFTTKLCPKTGNACRMLSGFMSCPNEAHWKAIEHTVGYLKGMKLRGVTYWEPNSMKIIAVSDTDFANCLETRRSVGCHFITVGGCLVDYSMTKHNTVSDSITEAEYKELSKTSKSAKFVLMLQQELTVADSPAIIFCDNSGAIFLSENLSVNKRTKHIDIKYHFIREFIQRGFGRPFKIESKDCIADIGTKNQEVSLFIKHEAEIDDGFPILRNKVYGKDGILAKDFGGMSE